MLGQIEIEIGGAHACKRNEKSGRAL